MDRPATAAGRTARTSTPPARERKVKRPRSRARSLSGGKKNNRREGKRGVETVQVICRFRPENKQEVDTGGRVVVELPEDSDKKVTLDIDEKSYDFAYDRVFKPFSTQEEVYDRVGKPILDSVMKGYNGAVIAYGQTGSGKTHTMLGPGFDGAPLSTKARADPGILPRILENLFLQAVSSVNTVFEVRASFIEIYRELVKDLLSPGSVRETESLKIRSDDARGLHLPQATEVPITTLEEAMAVLKTGSNHRRTAETGSNERSSRSHSVFLITVLRHEKEKKLTKATLRTNNNNK